jgi:hypothetical protein
VGASVRPALPAFQCESRAGNLCRAARIAANGEPEAVQFDDRSHQAQAQAGRHGAPAPMASAVRVNRADCASPLPLRQNPQMAADLPRRKTTWVWATS